MSEGERHPSQNSEKKSVCGYSLTLGQFVPGFQSPPTGLTYNVIPPLVLSGTFLQSEVSIFSIENLPPHVALINDLCY